LSEALASAHAKAGERFVAAPVSPPRPRECGQLFVVAAGKQDALAVVRARSLCPVAASGKLRRYGHPRHRPAARHCDLVGGVLGLNRDLHGKPTGVRTLGLVCLGSALAVLSIHEVSSTDASRIIQGIMTGVGFLGAGVIVRNSKGHHVHGLTTAACVWVTACIGAACAVAEWQIVVLGTFLVLVILVFGGPFEKAIDRRWPGQGPTDPGQETRSTTRVPSPEM
jgi:putative Mg2+ transporter-C (MgtC) family protein